MMNDIEAKILELWNQNKSTASIAAAVGKTKGSVCGLLWRMRRRGLVVPTKAEINPRESFRAKRHEERDRKIRFDPKIKSQPFERKNRPIPKESLNIGFWKLKAHSCRYVVNDGQPEQFIFCGATKERGSYCAAHAEICYMPPKVPNKEYQRANARFK